MNPAEGHSKSSPEGVGDGGSRSFRCFELSRLEAPIKWHRHPEVELVYVPDGSGSRVIGDHIDSYVAHDLVLIGSQIPHAWTSDPSRGMPSGRHATIVCQFHPELLSRQSFQVAELASIHALLQRSARALWFPETLGASVGQRLERLMTAEGAGRFIGFLSLLDELSQCASATPLVSNGYIDNALNHNTGQQSRIQMICDYIANHFTDAELTHRQLAKTANMNESAFSRFFKQSTGRTTSAYITELRIGLACRLLANTDHSILSICHKSGFSNLSNFNRRFRKLRQTAPREYRKRFREIALPH